MNLHVRAATLNDAAAIDDLINAFALVHHGRSLKPGSARERLTETDSLPALVADATGAVLGFGHVWRAGTVVRSYARVHPAATGQGVGTALMSYLEQRVRAFDLTTINTLQPASDAAAAQLLRDRGYTEFQYFLRMQVALADYRPPAAPTPAGVDIVGFDRDRDSAQLFATHRAIFPEDTDTEEQWWRYRCADPTQEFDPALWFVARQAGEIVGLCLGGRRDRIGSREGHLSDLGVDPRVRGQGIGFALLTTALTAFAADGLPTAVLSVDTDNPNGAVRLYRKAGMHPTPSATEWAKEIHSDESSAGRSEADVKMTAPAPTNGRRARPGSGG